MNGMNGLRQNGANNNSNHEQRSITSDNNHQGNQTETTRRRTSRTSEESPSEVVAMSTSPMFWAPVPTLSMEWPCSIRWDQDKYLLHCQVLECEWEKKRRTRFETAKNSSSSASSSPCCNSNGTTTTTTRRAIMAELGKESGNREISQLDRLPTEILRDKILPFVNRTCDSCKTTVVMAHTAVYLEEMIRTCNILTLHKKRWLLLNSIPVGNRAFGGNSSSCTFQSLEGCNTELTVKWDLPLDLEQDDSRRHHHGKDSSYRIPRGTIYEDQEEHELLGPFRFCLVQRHVVTAWDFLLLQECLYCPSCAVQLQKEHFQLQCRRILQARKEFMVAWAWKHVVCNDNNQKSLRNHHFRQS